MATRDGVPPPTSIIDRRIGRIQKFGRAPLAAAVRSQEIRGQRTGDCTQTGLSPFRSPSSDPHARLPVLLKYGDPRSPAMRFTKMHGIGNDYVYVNCFAEPMPADPTALSVKVADRHFGVGGDGLILICPSDKADARMRMFNADGSEAEMCGNGLRCVAKYVHDHGIARKPRLAIETGRGVLTVDLEGNGKAERVRVNM